MSRPSKTTRPAVGVNRPVTLLKSVVLPAPFGPMSANTSPRLMCRLTLSTATSPPKRLVRLVSSRMFSVLSGTRSLLDRRCFLQDRRMLELLLAHATRQQTLRPQQHHAHEDAAVDDEVQALRLFAEARPVATALVQRSKSDAARERGSILWQPGDQVEDEVVHHQRTDDDAGDVSHTAEHNHHQHRDRDDEQEVVRTHEGDVGCVVGACEAAEGGPDTERQQLGGDGVDPHRRGRDLILTNRHPGPSQARAVEVGDEAAGTAATAADKHVESDGVGIETERRHYLEVAVAGPGTLDPCRQQGLVDEADGVDAACPLVEVVEELGHDLPKSEGDDGEVVTS